MTVDMQVLARRMRQARKVKGLTQEDVARLAGVKLRTYGSYERGEVENPTLSTLNKIVHALEIDENEVENEPSVREFEAGGADSGGRPALVIYGPDGAVWGRFELMLVPTYGRDIGFTSSLPEGQIKGEGKGKLKLQLPSTVPEPVEESS